ncbi:hypothetical protein ACFV0C_14150 [Streptomyces sp. NPDC059568]|uniref:hypothetical protein n=1 Tax=Streptomyces sp. NPDC059568 TaxID=3346868 RepID=UPI00367F813A
MRTRTSTLWTRRRPRSISLTSDWARPDDGPDRRIRRPDPWTAWSRCPGRCAAGHRLRTKRRGRGFHPSRSEPAVRRLAVLGSPVSGALSPVLHRAAYAAMNLPWTYHAIECRPEELAPFSEHWMKCAGRAADAGAPSRPAGRSPNRKQHGPLWGDAACRYRRGGLSGTTTGLSALGPGMPLGPSPARSERHPEKGPYSHTRCGTIRVPNR